MAYVDCPGVAAEDGSLEYWGAGFGSGSWANSRAATGGNWSTNVSDPATIASYWLAEADYNYSVGNEVYACTRGFLSFDLSGIPAGSTITAVEIHVKAYAVNSLDGGSLCCVAGTQGSALTTGDWANFGATELMSRVTFASLATDWNTLTLNSSGVAAVQSAFDGSTHAQFCFRTSQDIDNTAPANATRSGVTVRFQDYSTSGDRPYLRVTYDSPAKTSSDTGTGADAATLAITQALAPTAVPSWTEAFSDAFSGMSNLQSLTGRTGWTLNYPVSYTDFRANASGRIGIYNAGGTAASSNYTCPGAGSYADGFAQVDAYIATVNALGYNMFSVSVRWPGGTSDRYYALIDCGEWLGTNGTLYLCKNSGGSRVILGTPYTIPGFAQGNTYTVKVEAIGNQITAYLDGTQRIQVTDSSVTAAGYAGLDLQCDAPNSTNGIQLDNFQAGPVSGGSYFIPAMTDLGLGAESASVMVPTEYADTPSLGVGHNLTISEVYTAPMADTPDLGVGHVLTVADALTLVDAPNLIVGHDIAPNDVFETNVMWEPIALPVGHDLTITTGYTFVEAPALATGHNLTVVDTWRITRWDEVVSIIVGERVQVAERYFNPNAPARIPNERELTPSGQALLEDLPNYYWTDPSTQAACNALGNELDRLSTFTTEMRGLATPGQATADQMPLWERLFELPSDSTLSLARRRGRATAMLRSGSDPSGAGWQSLITTALGTESWSYTEGPADFTVTISLPYAYGSDEANFAMTFIRRVTPANLALAWDFGDGFVLGVSAVGLDEL